MLSPVKITNLSKYFRLNVRGLGVQALSKLNLEVKEGEIFGLLGPNGAGKSTTIKIILGLLKQNSGECLVYGEKISNKIKSRIGYLPEAPNFYRFLTARELVSFYAKICGLRGKFLAERVEESLQMVGLGDAADRTLAGYSKGMLQRAGLAQAIVHNPDLIILDEPSSGLDPVGMNDMKEMILRLKQMGKTVLLCSHMMDEVEALCDSVAILYKGSVAISGSLDVLLKQGGACSLNFENLSDSAIEQIAEIARASGAKYLGKSDSKLSLAKLFGDVISQKAKK